MPNVEVRGLAEFKRELRKIDTVSSNEMRKVHRRVADLVANRARAGAASGGGQSAKAARTIKARSTNTRAYIDIVPTKAVPYALAVYWGQRRRSGWYAAGRYAGSGGRQFPPWVGNQWDPGETGSFGSAPYHIGPAIDASIDDALDIYLEGIDDIARRAFPD